MHLLECSNAGEFSLTEDLFGDNTPPYAILSHRWGANAEEVTFKNLIEGTGKNKAGYDKIRFCGEKAISHGIQYFWVDTCCIDKSNSAELQEAINSMYSWYREARVCFAYLDDVPSDDNLYAPESYFSKSRWFTRGWTLQELIAPSDVIFFARDWTRCGTKKELSSVISTVTGIPVRFLLGDKHSEASIAQRMHWASTRETTKIEDIAYCLLGIFDVQMPLIYGEREKAFRRLQEEILKVSDDHSIFAWTVNTDAEASKVDGGLLAYSPALFKQSGNIIRSPLPWARNYLMGIRTPIVLDNKGLHLALPLIPVGPKNEFQAILGCTDETKSHSKQAAIRLMDISLHGGRYKRYVFDKLEIVDLDSIQKFRYQQVCAQPEDIQLSSLFTDRRSMIFPRWPVIILCIFIPLLAAVFFFTTSTSTQMFAIIIVFNMSAIYILRLL